MECLSLDCKLLGHLINAYMLWMKVVIYCSRKVEEINSTSEVSKIAIASQLQVRSARYGLPLISHLGANS